MAPVARAMNLRIRCPSCRTVLSVAPGAVPTCPTCGFGGATHGAPEGQAEATEAPQWDAAGEPAQAAPAWEPAPEAAEGWEPAPAEGWAEPQGQAPEGWGEPAEAPKRRGLFGRRKK